MKASHKTATAKVKAVDNRAKMANPPTEVAGYPTPSMTIQVGVKPMRKQSRLPKNA